MGRKPKPTMLKIIEGNPGKRPLNMREPRPQGPAPMPPDWLNPIARAEWERIAPALERMGLLTSVDGAAMEAYCTAYARWVEAEQFLEKHGMTMIIRDERGGVKWLQPMPQVGISRSAAREMRAFASELGLTPASRTKLNVSDQGTEDEFTRWAKGG